MLAAQRIHPRFACPACKLGVIHQKREQSDDGNPFRGNGHAKTIPNKKRRPSNRAQPRTPVSELPSLSEQLFPEESARYKAQHNVARHVPPIPLEVPSVQQMIRSPPQHDQSVRSYYQRKLIEDTNAAGPQTSVLVLRNASTNLVEEDFRRLIPQGKHIDGWTLREGDIIKVVPERDLATLAPKNVYYLLFSSALHAFAYQGHVTKIHKLAALHTPSSVTSPIPPPPGYLIEGLDAHAAIQSYALSSPAHGLMLRQLKPPLSPLLDAIVKHRGFPSIVNRRDKMPFEVRLTLEGPQLPIGSIRHILMETSRARGLSWSGGDDAWMKVAKWTPRQKADELRSGETSATTIYQRSEEDRLQRDILKTTRISTDTALDQKRRTPPTVYVVGFHAESAAQSFIRYWHRRSFEWPVGATEAEGELPPIANAELLW